MLTRSQSNSSLSIWTWMMALAIRKSEPYKAGAGVPFGDQLHRLAKYFEPVFRAKRNVAEEHRLMTAEKLLDLTGKRSGSKVHVLT